MMDFDHRAFLLALTAMNVRVISELAALSPNKDRARELMTHFETSILADINKLTISLKPGETEDDLDRLRESARSLVADWMASVRFK